MPPGTEPRLVGSGPIPRQSASEESRFGFQAPAPLAAVNANLPFATDDDLSDQESVLIDPILRTPVHEESEDAGNDNISKQRSTKISCPHNQPAFLLSRH